MFTGWDFFLRFISEAQVTCIPRMPHFLWEKCNLLEENLNDIFKMPDLLVHNIQTAVKARSLPLRKAATRGLQSSMWCRAISLSGKSPIINQLYYKTKRSVLDSAGGLFPQFI